ncbi:MAG: RNA polymerase sigma factor [Gemmataceae bacterium]|nr:RNA polymerase sigma factor [Gemmataceae bacterium]
MAPESVVGVVTQLRRAIDAHAAEGPTDAELLGHFLSSRDHSAFELLVWRHGAMVLQTCRRVVYRIEDAEDAFQATFLALVRQAAAIGKRESVAGWLHRVACRIALRLRVQAARRAHSERMGALRSVRSNEVAGAELDPLAWAEVRQMLDGELDRLPAKLRAPFILCHLEGLTNEEAARQLGCPKGTILSRLSRARERLRHRLSRRGVTLAAGALSAGLAQEATALTISGCLVISTVQAALLVAAGQATAGVVSAPVAAMTEGVLRAMFLSKLKVVLAVCLGVGVVASGTTELVYQCQAQAAGQGGQSSKTASTPDAHEQTQIELDRVKSQLAAVEAQASLAKAEVLRAQEMLRIAQAELDQKRAVLEAAQARHKQALQNAGLLPKEDRKKSALPQTPPPDSKKSTPPPIPPQEPAKGHAFLGAIQSDLIQLATVYVDALRDMETSKLHVLRARELAKAVGGGSGQEEIKRVELLAAERKVLLLRAILDGALQGAEVELRDAQRGFESGLLPAGHVSAAQTKVHVLKLILDTAK